MFGISIIGFALDEVGAPDKIIQSFHTDFGKILPYFLCQESEEVDQIFTPAVKTLTQFFILSGNAYRTGIHVTFTHHYATQYDQCRSCKSEFFGTQHSH